MELTLECPRCGTVNRVREVQNAQALACRACGESRAVATGACAGGALAKCAQCGADDLYIQKDFPHLLGLGIVVAGFVVSSIFWAFYMPIAALAVLLVTAALDLILYYLVPDVTICYRCLSQYRGQGANPESRFAPFDLAIGERYRQERLRVEQLRQNRRPADQVPPA